jgi:hypothetical protein
VKKLVKESLIEGVADKYAEQTFNIPDKEANFRLKGEDSPVAFIKDDNDIVISIFKNPKNLDNIGKSVRAMGDKDGNLYIAQYPGEFNHGDMANTLVDKGFIDTEKYTHTSEGIYDDPSNFILLIRMMANIFVTSNSYEQVFNSEGLLQKLRDKHSNMIFKMGRNNES